MHEVAAAARYLWRKLLRALLLCYELLRKVLVFLARPAFVLKVAIVLLVLVVLYCGTFYWLEQQVPKPLPVDQFVFMDQGWGGKNGTSDDRLLFYYSPQGAYVKNVRYDWFVNLERPWKTDRFREPKYMRGYGFIVDQESTDKNPHNLPIGFAKSWDPRSASMMLDLTCAACHTGELQVVKNNKRIAVRIDGGQAMHAITSTKPGSFGLDLMTSLVSTELNPFKWSRFERNVLQAQDTLRESLHLRMDVARVIFDLSRQTLVEKVRHLYPEEEGFGRTDALGRIANNVFATNLVPKNYHVANAPVSYPPLWDIWKFDWVQYTGSVAQPMARNIGQSLGTGAQYDLVDEYGKAVDPAVDFHTSAKIASLVGIEETLRRLKAPVWDENLFGSKNEDRYKKGKELFKEYCYRCHGVVYASESQRAMEAPLKEKKEDHWRLRTLQVQAIGTDPTSAFNFFRNRYDLTSMGLNPEELRDALRDYYQERFLRKQPFDTVTCEAINDWKKSQSGIQGVDGVKRSKNSQTGASSPSIPDDYYQYCDDKAAMQAAAQEARLSHGTKKPEDIYADAKLSHLDLSSVSSGEGLNYIIALIRRRAYIDMVVKDDDAACDSAVKMARAAKKAGPAKAPSSAKDAGPEDQDVDYEKMEEALPVACRREELDGFGQLDTPRVEAVYRARPLEGIWATAPFLHNGSVPNLYEMLIPANQRSKKFYVKGRTFDPRMVGLLTDSADPQAFLFDTTKPGNSNSGHEFRAGYTGRPAYGVIGPELKEDERWAIIEYLKFMKNDDFPTCLEYPSNCVSPLLNAQAGKSNK
jgi:hypothetical protein